MGERAGRARSTTCRLTAGVIAAVWITTLTAGAAGAQTAGDEWRNGEAEASADTFTLNIKQGNANIGFTYGRSIVNYRDKTGTAEARALDLGVLPTLFGEVQCDGSPPTMNPATFPPNTRVDSTNPDASKSRRAQAFLPGLQLKPAGPSAGWQDATATPLPSARGITESANADLGIFALKAGRTEVSTKVENKTREAVAVTTADELKVFGGLFIFKKPRWEATVTSGATTKATGSFTFEKATVLGAPKAPDQALRDLAGFEKALEDLLRPLGVELNLPRLEINDGRVRVTPIEFLIKDMPFGAKAIAPFLGDIQPLKEVLTKQMLDEDCKAAGTLLLLDVILGILAGSGSIEMMVGGVDVMTADTDFSSPPLEPLPVNTQGSAPPPIPEPPPEVSPISAPIEMPPLDDFSTSDLGLGDFSMDDLGDFDSSLPELGLDDEYAAPVATEVRSSSAGNDEELAAMPASSASTLKKSGAGAAIAVGLIGLLGAIGLSFGERILARRTTRRIP